MKVMSKIKRGDSLKEAKIELIFPFEDGHLVWCNRPSSTTTRGNSYRVRGVFAYRNKYSYGWQWDYFITIKNDNATYITLTIIYMHMYV